MKISNILLIALIVIMSGASFSYAQSNTNNEQQKVDSIFQCPMMCEDGKIYKTPGSCPICVMNFTKIVYSNWSGGYVSKSGKKLKLFGPGFDGTIKFELTQATEACTLQVEGIASLTESDFAYFGDEIYILNFTFKQDSIFLNGADIKNNSKESCRNLTDWYYIDKGLK